MKMTPPLDEIHLYDKLVNYPVTVQIVEDAAHDTTTEDFRGGQR